MTEILGLIATISALGVITLKKPVHACLSFLLTLLTLAALFLELSAPFIAVMQVLVYAGAILVIFMFVIVLFQDAYKQIEELKANSSPLLIFLGAVTFVGALTLLGSKMSQPSITNPESDFSSVASLGKTLYIDFFFPFEAIGVLFLVALIGSVYLGKKVQA